MTTPESIKSESFVMVVDRDAYRVLNYMMNIFDAQGSDAMKVLYRQGLSDRTISLMKEFADKAHEANFCEDPKCPHKVGTYTKKSTSTPIVLTTPDERVGTGFIEDGMAVIDLGDKGHIRFTKPDLKDFILGLGTLYANL